MVTKEDVDKAKAEWKAAFDAADTIAALAANDAADAAWDRYHKLREKFENESESNQRRR